MEFCSTFATVNYLHIYRSALSFLFALATLSLFYSCDKVDEPWEQKADTTVTVVPGIKYDTTYSEPNAGKRYVVVEEFTGFKCPNCPDGAAEIKRLDSIYGKALLPVSIHSNVFAKPDSSTVFKTDFRTPEGNDYDQTFLVGFYPSAMISRKIVGGEKVLPKGSWQSTIVSIINSPAFADIDLVNLYNDSLKKLNITAKIKWLSSSPASYKLLVYLIEDHIYDWQKVGSIDIQNYDHRHVLRKALNGTWGIQLSSSNAGDTSSFQFSATLIPAWKSADCEVVAYMYNSANYEIIQANEAKVKK